MAQEVIKAAPPPPPPDWAGAIERGLGHLASVVMAAIGAKTEKDAAPSLKRLEKRVARLQKAISRGLPAPQRPDGSQAEPQKAPVEPPTVSPSSVAKPATAEKATSRDDSDDPPSAPKVAATDTTPKASTPESVESPTKADASSSKRTTARRDKPNTTAWNRIKRVVASLTDGEITMFVAQPQLGLSFLACLAELCPGGALATC